MIELSCLPWFIRKDIINFSLDHSPAFGLLSKEWFIETAKQHGETVLNSEKPEGYLRNPSYVKYFGMIRFYRIDHIDWETIYSYEQLHTIEISVGPIYSKDVCDEFISKFLQLPSLKRIQVGFRLDNPYFDLPRLLTSQHKMKKLSILSESLELCLNSDSVEFPSLVDLTITELKSILDLKLLLKKAPKLEKLIINSYNHEDTLFHFGDHIISGVKELFINFSDQDQKVKLDLSKWPNLKKLGNNHSIEFTDLNHFTNIEDLTLTGSNHYMSSVLCANLPKLRRLSLRFHGVPDIDLVNKMLKLCTTITSLKLSFHDYFELPENLPIGPYTVTNLHLKGCVIINSNLLRWLSTSFSLIKLKLNECLLGSKNPLETVSFATLTLLKIVTIKYDRFENYFNHTMYPHINFIVIRQADYHRRHLSEIFSTNLGETRMIVNPMKINMKSQQ